MGPLSYLSIGLGSLVLVLTGLLYISNSRLDSCNSDRARLTQQLVTLEDKLDTQNKAVEGLKKASQEAQDRVRMAVDGARKRSEALDRERGRLKTLMAQKPANTACPAGVAVQHIRDGLK